MNEGSVSDTSKFESEDSQGTGDGHGAANQTAGRVLRLAREAAGMSLPSMASALKVPLVKLQALEDDDYAFFPDHVFMRALAMGFCRYLRVDPAPVMALLPSTQLKSLAGSGGSINETYKERNFKGGGTSLGGSSGQSSRKVIAAVLVLLAAAAAVYFVPRHQDDAADAAGGSAGTTSTSAAVTSSPAAPVTAGTSSAGESAIAGSDATNSAGAANTAPGMVTDTVLHNAPAASDGAAATGAGAAIGAATAVAPATAATTALLQIRSGSQSWVRVKDAHGKVVVEKTLSKDESLTAEGALPLSVIVGNAKDAQVTVRGEPLDIVKGMRDSVARFEVK